MKGFPMFQFKQAMLQVADKALQSNQITEDEYNQVVVAMSRPLRHLKVRKYVIQKAVKAGALPTGSENAPEKIDWNALLDFLTKLMPLILAFIQALSGL
jgi:hypothetical protein